MEEVQEGELWTVNWWDDAREDRSKSGQEFRPFEETGQEVGTGRRQGQG